MKNDNENKENPVEKYGNVVGEFLRIQDVLGFFKYDINPSYLDAKVEAAIAKEQKGQRQVPFQWIIAIGALILFAAIGFVIISGQLQSGTCQQQLTECLKSGQKVVTATPSVPIETEASGIGLR